MIPHTYCLYHARFVRSEWVNTMRKELKRYFLYAGCRYSLLNSGQTYRTLVIFGRYSARVIHH